MMGIDLKEPWHRKFSPRKRFEGGLIPITLLAVGFCLLFAALSAADTNQRHDGSGENPLVIAPLGSYETGLGEDSAEVAAYSHNMIYVTNSDDNSFDIVDIGDPAKPVQIARIPLDGYGASPNSVAVHGRIVAVAMEADPKSDPGTVVFFNTEGDYLNQVTVGALPDMITFARLGRYLLVANEGEPDNGRDPEGTVSVISVPRSPSTLAQLSHERLQARVRTAGFAAFSRKALLSNDVRLPDESVNPARDLEPEYITVSPNSRYAYVSLQENNALARLDIKRAKFKWVRGLGRKDHSLPGNGLDASDRDDAIHIANWPVLGMYMPDAIAAFKVKGKTYIISANEGDARNEDERVKKLNLDPGAFPDADVLQKNENIGRLQVSAIDGDLDNDGDYDELHAYGARSFTIWDGRGDLVYDSGDIFEKITAAVFPEIFNSDNDENSFDTRSDNKGPEPEAVTTGRIRGRTYAFIGLERIGGIMVFDVTNPREPEFVQYTNNRDVSLDPPGPDSAPEILVFIPKHKSPNSKALLLAANEVSGTVTIYGAGSQNQETTLSLLHNNDGESSLRPFTNHVNGTALPVGGIAAFKSLTSQEIRQARRRGNSVVNVYAGDAFLASSTLACSLPPNPPQTPVYDAVAQRRIPYDLHILGNHEFDFSPDFLERFIRSFRINGILNQPFLSANLDLSHEPGFDDLVQNDGIIPGFSTDGQVIAQAAVVTDTITGQRFGVVGATTPTLPTISSPRDVMVTSDDLDSTAVVVQSVIDRLMHPPYNLERIILVSHLQDIGNDRELIPLLRGVDVAVAGGGDELLVNPDLSRKEQLLPGEEAPVAGDYPIMVRDGDGRSIPIVTTAGNYKYLGRLDITFDGQGEVIDIVSEHSFPRRVIPTSDAAVALGLAGTVEPDAQIITEVITPVEECLDGLDAAIIKSNVKLDVSRAGVRAAETNSGNLITDAYRYTYDRLAAINGLPALDETVIAVQNGGGIRQNAGDVLPADGVVPGKITRADTLDVLAFLTNTVTVVRSVTPQEMKQILERSASRLPDAGGQFLQVGGFTVAYDISRTAQVIDSEGNLTIPGERVISAVLSDGTEIISGGAVNSAAPALTVVTNSFTAGGGDNYPWLGNNPDKVHFPVTYEQAWVEFMLTFPAEALEGSQLPAIQDGGPYSEGGEGRITVVSPE
jgi:2',3'-cyclic-nucleotide 2'-phosphodiesterase (5'-nucleotidase family)